MTEDYLLTRKTEWRCVAAAVVIVVAGAVWVWWSL